MSVSRFVVRHSLMSVLLVLLAACGSGSSAGGGGTSTPPPGGGTPPTTPEVPQPEPPAPTASIGSCEATGAARTAERLARMRPGTLGQFVVAFDGNSELEGRIRRGLGLLGDRAGPLLVQLSPRQPVDLPRLAWFLARLPPELRGLFSEANGLKKFRRLPIG